MSDKAKRASWLAGLLTVVIAATGLIGSAAGHWSDTQSRLAAVETKTIEIDARMTRSEMMVHGTLAEIRADVNGIKRHLMERSK